MSWRMLHFLTSFKSFYDLFDDMTHFLTSWHTFWRHDERFVIQTYFITHFSRPKYYENVFGRHNELFDFLTCFWRHDEFLDVKTCFSRHDELLDVMTCSWSHDELFVKNFVMTCFGRHMMELFDVMTCFWLDDKLFDFRMFLTSCRTFWRHDLIQKIRFECMKQRLLDLMGKNLIRYYSMEKLKGDNCFYIRRMFTSENDTDYHW